MKTVKSFSPLQTVGDVLSRHPGSFQVFQNLQEKTDSDGICYITRDDTLRELARRYGFSTSRVLHELRDFVEKPT